jgi:hypothetical protein
MKIGCRETIVKVSQEMPAWVKVRIHNLETGKTLVRSLYLPNIGAKNGSTTIEDHATKIILPREIADYIITESASQREEIESTDRRRQARIESIAGLTELRRAIADQNRYARQFGEMMEDEGNDGARPPRAPAGNLAELAIQYPAAAAYLQAESMSCAANYAKAGAGKRSIERIGDGADPVQALADAEREWSDAAARMVD